MLKILVIVAIAAVLIAIVVSYIKLLIAQYDMKSDIRDAMLTAERIGQKTDNLAKKVDRLRSEVVYQHVRIHTTAGYLRTPIMREKYSRATSWRISVWDTCPYYIDKSLLYFDDKGDLFTKSQATEIIEHYSLGDAENFIEKEEK